MKPFDPVHDSQAIFRGLLDGLARPGTVMDLAPFPTQGEGSAGMHPAFELLARVLLDAHTSFAVVASDDAEASHLSRWLRALTLAATQPATEAAHLFIARGAPAAVSAIASAGRGTLEDPHLGTTIILEVVALASGPTLAGDAPRYRIEGPGIDGSLTIAVASPCDWVAARAPQVAEFPLGIELLLVDEKQQLLALPRTTRVHRVGGG